MNLYQPALKTQAKACYSGSQSKPIHKFTTLTSIEATEFAYPWTRGDRDRLKKDLDRGRSVSVSYEQLLQVEQHAV
jgi:hypothetical protein